MEERTIVSFGYAIKYLLREKANFGITSGFLRELLKRKVEVTAILESESNKDVPDKKTNRVDMKAQIDGAEIAVFEIQFLETVDFFGKVLFGVSKAVVEQVSEGARYDIKKIYSVNIAYYNIGARREYLFNGKFDGFKGVHFKDETIPFTQAGDLAAKSSPKRDIHPEYYLILPEMFDGQMRDRFDEWVYVLKKSAVRNDFTAEGIKEALQKLDKLQMSPEQRNAYNRYLEDRYSVESAIRTGIMTGREEGEAKGREEMAAEIAKELKFDGMPVEKIAQITGLATEYIKKI